MQGKYVQTIGDKIRKLRQSRRMSQEDLSFEINVARQTISKWESDVAFPDTCNIHSLCKAFDVKFDYFLADGDAEAAAAVTEEAARSETQALEAAQATETQPLAAEEKTKKKIPHHHKFLYITAGVILGAVFVLSLVIMISMLVAHNNEATETVISTTFNTSPEWICGIICGVIILVFVIFFLYRFFKKRTINKN